MTEEERAALFRRQAQAREDNALARWVALKGSAQELRGLLLKTAPLTKAPGWDPIKRSLLSEYT